jgi:beta-N-acetylhexosaminidase
MPTSVLRRTVAQLFVVGIPGPELDRPTREFLTEHPPGGICLFRRNVRSAGQLRRLAAALHGTGAGVPPFVSIDHEGGRVDRLPRPFTHFPPATAVGVHGVRAAAAVGRAMGIDLRTAGIDIDFAPVLDVWTNPRNRVIGDRAFATEPERAARLALAFARGLQDAGVLACGKHFPGHGASTGDSHFVLPRVAHSRRTLRATELVPFVRWIRAGFPALMTSHVVYPAYDRRRPATLSPRIARELLRRELGYRGLLFSDDLEMQAAAGRHPPGRLAMRALEAGCDMLLFCQSVDTARAAMLGVEQALAAGRLEARIVVEALARIHRLRAAIARLRGASSPRLGWPAHARLARRLAPRAAAPAA